MISSRVLAELGERIAEDGSATHHRLLQHLSTLLTDSAPGTAAALADRNAPDVVRQRALAVASARLLRRSTAIAFEPIPPRSLRVPRTRRFCRGERTTPRPPS